jgi:hypothetical protein
MVPPIYDGSLDTPWELASRPGLARRNRLGAGRTPRRLVICLDHDPFASAVGKAALELMPSLA